MATTVQVLLLEDIDSLGRVGDIVAVSDGYARNFLFPNGKAALATKQVQHVKAAKDTAVKKRAEEELQKNQQLADSLENTEITISAKVRSEENLFGSILAKTIAERLLKDSNLSVPLKNIKGPFPIKKIGTYDVTIVLSEGVEFHIAVVVIPDA
jgi:large subunit ribosomal protein L9